MTDFDTTSYSGVGPGGRARPAGVLLDGPYVCENSVLIVGDGAYAHRLQQAFVAANLVVKSAVVSDFYMALGHVSRHRPAVVIGDVTLLVSTPTAATSSATPSTPSHTPSGSISADSGESEPEQVASLDTTARQVHAIATGFRQLAPQARLIVTASSAQKILATLAMEQGFDDRLIEPWTAAQLAFLVDRPQQVPRGRQAQAEVSASSSAASAVRSAGGPGPMNSQDVATSQTDEAANYADDFELDPWLSEADASRKTDVAGNQRGGRQQEQSEPRQADSFHGPSVPSEAGVKKDSSAVPAGAYHNDPYDTSDVELGDIDLVDQLLSAPGAFDQLVLKMVAARSGVAHVGFVSKADLVPQGHIGSWVSHRGKRLGVLHAPPPAVKAQLTSWASWMGHWLALERQMKLLWHKAHEDELSGAWNRRFFDHHLDRVINQAAQRRLPVTLLVFDIDNFKTYNDRYGHAAGDEILHETVRLMRSVIREHDVVARIGGDEFAVIFWDPQGPRKLNSSHPDDVRAAAQRFQKAICAHHFPKLLEEAPGTLTISGGLASYPWDGATAAALVERADAMLLHSKSQGKNAITFGTGAAHTSKEQDPFAH